MFAAIATCVDVFVSIASTDLKFVANIDNQSYECYVTYHFRTLNSSMKIMCSLINVRLFQIEVIVVVFLCSFQL